MTSKSGFSVMFMTIYVRACAIIHVGEYAAVKLQTCTPKKFDCSAIYGTETFFLWLDCSHTIQSSYVDLNSIRTVLKKDQVLDPP